MNILIVISYFAPAWGYGGPPKVMRDIAQNLVKLGHNVTVYTTDAFDEDRFRGPLTENIDGVTVVRFKNFSNILAWRRKRFLPFSYPRSLRSTIRQFDFVIMSDTRTFQNLFTYRQCIKNSIPYGLYCFGSLPRRREGIKTLYDFLFVKPMIRYASHLFAQTENEVNEYRKAGGREEQIRLLPLPVEYEESCYSGNPVDKLRLAFVGRIHYLKGLQNVIAALSFIKDRVDFEMHIIGRDDGYLQYILTQVEANGLKEKVFFHGPLYGQEKKDILCGSNLFMITPLNYEETSTAALEAAVAGCALVITPQTDIPYLKEYNAGMMISNEPEVIASTIEELSNDIKSVNIMGLNARRLVKEKFDIKVVSRHFEQLLRKVVDEKKARSLFIASLPYPMTGQALASQVLLEAVARSCQVEVVNFQKATLRPEVTLRRALEVIRMLIEIRRKKKSVDVIYLTISQSLGGNLRDLLTYLICFDKLSATVIHLHGGGIGKIIFDRHPFLYKMNKVFLKRVGAAVVLGKSLTSIFEDTVSKERIHVVPNFAEDNLFLSAGEIEEKYKRIATLKILFLSNLILGKGHEELLKAYKLLDKDTRRKVTLDFAGGFESESEKKKFMEEIEGEEGISYRGVVFGHEKRQLLEGAHVFCLPTYYTYEGQPIALLEAYASGCVVVTTDHGGIRDVFADGRNGYYVEKKSIDSLRAMLKKLVDMPARELLEIAMYNRTAAGENYRVDRYVHQMTDIFENMRRRGDNSL